MKKAKTLKKNHIRRYTKRRFTNKRRFTKKKYKRRKKFRGGVCPCAVPLSTTAASYVATALGGLGIYSLSKKKRKKPKK